MNTPPTFCGNIRVKAGRTDNEYLALQLQPLDAYFRFRAMIYRYCVPGRFDTYSFAWETERPVPKLVYFSDGWQDMSKTMKMVAEDFDKPQVVELFLNAFSAERIVRHYRHDVLNMLAVIAPKSKTYKKLKTLCEKTMAAQQ